MTAVEEAADGALQLVLADGGAVVCDGSLQAEKLAEARPSVRTLVPDLPAGGLEIGSTGVFWDRAVFMIGGHRVTVFKESGSIEVTDRSGDWEVFDRINAENGREIQEKLAAAKAEAAERGKEPFDVVRMLELYEPYDQYRYPAPLDDLARRHERSYYLTNRELMTLAEYADYLRNADMG